MVQIASIISILPRGAAAVFAMIILIVSAASIGIINGNDLLKSYRDYDGPTLDSDDFNFLRGLVISTQDAASWLIFQSIVVAIVQVVAIVLFIFITQQTPRIIVGVLDIIFTVLTVLCYFGSAISTAVYAAAWNTPPKICDSLNAITDDDPCDAMPLTATNALEALFCFIQIGVFIAIGIMTIFDIVRTSQGGGQQTPGKV